MFFFKSRPEVFPLFSTYIVNAFHNARNQSRGLERCCGEERKGAHFAFKSLKCSLCLITWTRHNCCDCCARFNAAISSYARCSASVTISTADVGCGVASSAANAMTLFRRVKT